MFLRGKKYDMSVNLFYSVLYWISGISGSRSIVRGTWTRETPRVLISAANLNNPSSLQYDVMSHRLVMKTQSCLGPLMLQKIEKGNINKILLLYQFVSFILT